MKKLVVILFAFFSYSIFAQETEKRLALVIGNANYDKGVLKNPVNDARLIASTLDSLDFDVILKENLSTKRDMTAAIREFGSKRSEYDVAFVYYAGHGIQVDNENFLLPTKEVFEEEYDVLDFGVSVQDIIRYLRAQTDEVNILILDACRDNPFESKWNTTRSLKSGGLAKIPPPTGSLIAFSTDSGQTAPDGDGDNSTYTVSLAKNMLLENTSIDQVFRNVRAEVLAQTDGMQRPVENTQLIGKSFLLRKTFSIYNSTVEEIINFCDKKLQKGTLEEAFEILDSGANFYEQKKEVENEVILREKLIDYYLLNPLYDGKPKYFSLFMRNLDYTKIDYIEFKKEFSSRAYQIFKENFEKLFNLDPKYNSLVDKGYYSSLFYALTYIHYTINYNYFNTPEVLLPSISLKNEYLNNDLAKFWFLKIKYLDYRTNPLNGQNYLINSLEEFNSYVNDYSMELIDLIDTSNFDFTKSKVNEKLIYFTKSIYPNIRSEIERMICDIIAYNNTNNSNMINLLTSKFSDFNDVFSGVIQDDYSEFDLEVFNWYLLALESQISRAIFNSNEQSKELNTALKYHKNCYDYLFRFTEKIRTINFEEVEDINEHNNFILKSNFRPNYFFQKNTFIFKTSDKNAFETSKSTMIEACEMRLNSVNNFLNLLDNLKNKEYSILEDKQLLENWELFSHELLFQYYIDYLKNSSFSSSQDSNFKTKMINYEKEYKLNFINQVFTLKYLNFIKSYEAGDNMTLFWDLEILTSLSLIDKLISTDFGSKDDILFLNYASLHIKLLISSKSNFCFNPFDLKQDYQAIISENSGSQNFLLNAYLEDLDSFFTVGSTYYNNLLNHFKKNQLDVIFEN